MLRSVGGVHPNQIACRLHPAKDLQYQIQVTTLLVGQIPEIREMLMESQHFHLYQKEWVQWLGPVRYSADNG